MTLEGRVVLVTGAGSGIGQAVALRLGTDGAVVAMLEIDAERAEGTLRLLGEHGHHGEIVVGDTSNEDDVARAVGRIVDAHGRLDAVVACAGIGVLASVEETTRDDWERVLAVNLTGPYLLAKHALPHMRRAGAGSIVHIASVNGFWAEPRTAAYIASKGGLMALTRSIAVDCGADGIRANCICPGVIDTNMARAYFELFDDPEAERQAAADRHLLRRVGRPEEVANMAAFLVGDESTFCTGQAFVVDGGLTAGIAAEATA